MASERGTSDDGAGKAEHDGHRESRNRYAHRHPGSEDLLLPARRRRAGRGRRDFLHPSRQDARRCRRERLRQERDGPVDHADRAQAGPHRWRRNHAALRWGERAGKDNRSGAGISPDAQHPRLRHQPHLPGADDFLQPGAYHREPAYGDYPASPERLPPPGEGPRGGAAGPGGDPRPQPGRRPLHLRILRRHAPACDDRHGADASAQPAHRGRADDGAGCNHRGANPPADAPAAGRARHGDHVHHP
ncbi:MAG: hypothetical protein BWY52_02616 [Chloroflexi bacterium ADurb.Bin325]|nr:MAG: hypothetical protein BWY52_02616 [Chloroflexi bacterium ADurb.Bin325]